MAKDFHRPTITAEEVELLWKEGIFVWDTSAICSLYSLTPQAKETFVNILEELKDRIWIPARVSVEYERHRKEMVGQIISEHYKYPEFLSTHYLGKLDDFIKKIKANEYYHPQISKENITELESLQKSAGEILDKIRIVTENCMNEGKEKVMKDANHDIINEAISELEHGEAFTFKEIMDIIREGDIRYKNMVPPGYMDQEQKKSIDRFGDLIIWKEICHYASEKRKPVIFICNDVKEDWNAGNGKTGEMVPREELVEEFHSATSKNVWFYTLNGFISKLIERIQHEPVKENNDQLTAVLRELELMDIPEDCIKVICSHCGAVIGFDTYEFNWEWDFASSDDRGMGEELCFEYSEILQCPECGNNMDFAFTMYQYPINIVNYIDLETNGCTILSTPPLTDFISYNGYDACVRCGEYSNNLNEDGFCQNCMDEFDYECNRDD